MLSTQNNFAYFNDLHLLWPLSVDSNEFMFFAKNTKTPTLLLSLQTCQAVKYKEDVSACLATRFINWKTEMDTNESLKVQPVALWCIHSMQFICICRKAIISVKANLSANFWENIWLGAARQLFKVVFFFFCPQVVQAKMWFQVWSCQAENILFATSTYVFFWPSGHFILLQFKRFRLASTSEVKFLLFGQLHR